MCSEPDWEGKPSFQIRSMAETRSCSKVLSNLYRYVMVLPLSVPGLAATGILVLIMAWNEYLFALFLTSANSQTLPLLVAAQNATRGPQWWMMSVLILVMIIPVTALAMLASAPALAQGVPGFPMVPLGYCQLSASQLASSRPTCWC